MTQSPESEPSSLSVDQQEIAKYFASERYKQRQVIARDHTGSRQLVILAFPPAFSPGPPSFFGGLAGLSALTVMFGFLFPILMEAISSVMNRGTPVYWKMMVILQSLFFPPIITFSFTAVVPMFWYGSLLIRFALASLVVLPGCFAFLIGFQLVENENIWYDFAVVMFSCFLAIAAVAVTVQLWTPWTLSHRRLTDQPLPPTGLRSMIELTGLAAIGFAAFVTSDTSEYLVGILFFAALGALAAGAILFVLIALLRESHHNKYAAVISFAFAFATAFVVNGFFAAMEYGWEVLTYEILLVGVVSLYGAIVISGLMWLSLWWLRQCGWSCVNRNTASKSGTAW